jgi:hypothetical protein
LGIERDKAVTAKQNALAAAGDRATIRRRRRRKEQRQNGNHYGKDGLSRIVGKLLKTGLTDT